MSGPTIGGVEGQNRVTQADVTFANHVIAGFRQMCNQEWFANATDRHWLAKDIARHRAALTASSTSGMPDGGARPPAIYLAARFSQRPECNALAHRLKALGCTITSRWVRPDDDHVLPTGLSRQAEDSERRRFAMEDCEDVRASDWIVSLQGEPRSGGRGGRHIEFGYALALGKRMVSIGPRETVFHHMDEVEQFDTADEFIASLAQPDAVTSGMPDRGEGGCRGVATASFHP